MWCTSTYLIKSDFKDRFKLRVIGSKNLLAQKMTERKFCSFIGTRRRELEPPGIF